MGTAIIYTTPDTTAASSTSSSSQALSANYDMFLQLLTTQLKTQDPLDPTDTSEFTSQLVQYSNLEQQINTNEKLDEIMGSLNAFSMSTGVGYVGRTVETEGDTLTVGADGAPDASWGYVLASDAASVTLTITNEDGDVVWTGSGETDAGSHALEWDGKDADGNTVPEGAYTLTVAAEDSSGATIATATTVSGTVTGVSSVDGTVVLELGDTGIALDAITRLIA